MKKFIIFPLILFCLLALGGPPIIWKGNDAQLLTSGDLLDSGGSPVGGISGTGTDERIMRWNGTSGAQDSVISLIDTSGNLTNTVASQDWTISTIAVTGAVNGGDTNITSGSCVDGTCGNVNITSGNESGSGSNGRVNITSTLGIDMIGNMGHAVQAVALTSDNQVVVPTSNFITLTSDNASEATRTFILTQCPVAGQMLYMVFTGANSAQFLDNSANAIGGFNRLRGDWNFLEDEDAILLICDGTDFFELTRSPISNERIESIFPDGSGIDLGNASLRFSEIHGDTVFVTTLDSTSQLTFDVAGLGNIRPLPNRTVSLGVPNSVVFQDVGSIEYEVYPAGGSTSKTGHFSGTLETSSQGHPAQVNIRNVITGTGAGLRAVFIDTADIDDTFEAGDIFLDGGDNAGSGTGGDIRSQPGQSTSGIDGIYFVKSDTVEQESFDAASATTNRIYDQVTTTDATVTTAATIILPGLDDDVYHIEVYCVGKESGTNGASYKLAGTFSRFSSTNAQIGSTTTVHSAEDIAAWDCTLDISTDIRVRVTGEAATTIDWTVMVKIYFQD